MPTSDNGSSIFFVGTYSRKGAYFPNASGEGAVTCKLDLQTGHIDQLSACQEAVNATYLSDGPAGILLVASDRYLAPGKVQAFSIGDQGHLTLVSTQSAHGTATCHVTYAQESRHVFVASYMDGKLSTHIINDGELSAAIHVYSYQGSGPNKERQEAAHAHQAVISPDGASLFVCDLGSDKVWVHDMATMSGDIAELTCIEVPAGYGPRHLAFHPELPIVYILCELSSHILRYNKDDQTGAWTLIDDIGTLPDDYEGTPSAAGIRLHPSGKSLYVSNRGHDSISTFSIDQGGGLTYEARFSTEGKEPRDFGVDPTRQWLLAANQDSSSIVTFALDPDSGLPTGRIGEHFSCGTPVCVHFPKALNNSK